MSRKNRESRLIDQQADRLRKSAQSVSTKEWLRCKMTDVEKNTMRSGESMCEASRISKRLLRKFPVGGW